MTSPNLPKAKQTGLALLIVLLTYYLLHLPLIGFSLLDFSIPKRSESHQWSAVMYYSGLLLITLTINKIVSEKIEFKGKPANIGKTSFLAFFVTYLMILIGLFLLVFALGWIQVTYKISHNPFAEYPSTNLLYNDRIGFSLSASPKNLDLRFILIIPLGVATFCFVVFERIIYLFGEMLVWFFASLIMIPFLINSYLHNTDAGEKILFFLFGYFVYLITKKIWLVVAAVFAMLSSILLFSPDGNVYGYISDGYYCSKSAQFSVFQFIDLPSNFFNPMKYHTEIGLHALVNWQSWWEILAPLIFLINSTILLIGAQKGKFIRPFWIREKVELPKP